MNRNAVRIAANQESSNATAMKDTAAQGLRDRCTLLYAPSAAKKQKYPLNPAKTDLFIAVIATVK
jgi:hypothetical protein